MPNIKNIVYQTAPGEQTDFEFEYIDKVIFRNVSHRNYFDFNSCTLLKENPIIIYSNDLRNIEDALNEYITKNKNYILFHLSNEHLNHNAGYYRHANVVFRSLYDPNIQSKNVFVLPLGFKSGFINLYKNEIPQYQRDLVWTFVGQIKSNRQEMKDTFEKIKPHHIHTTSGWSSADQKDIQAIAELYKRTIFVPCPFGNIHADTFRVMECLEYGCIPVGLKFLGIDYYKYIFGTHPFVVKDDWRQCVKEMERLLNDKESLRRKQLEVYEWYTAFLQRLSNDVSRIVKGDTENLESEQFALQRKGMKDLALRFKFYRHFVQNKSFKPTLWKRIKNRAVLLLNN